MVKRAAKLPRVLACGAVTVAGCAELDPTWAEGEAHRAIGCEARASALTLFPADSAVEAGDGRVSEIHFRAVAALDDGTFAEVPAAWAASRHEIGEISDAGQFVPSGERDGEVVVTAEALGRVASTKLTVRLHRTDTGDAPDWVIAKFASDAPRRRVAELRITEPAPETELGDQAPAVIRWNGGDYAWFRVVLVSQTTQVSLLTSARSIDLTREQRSWIVGGDVVQPVTIRLEAVRNAAEATVAESFDAPRLRFCAAAEACNGLDDDCDSVADESCRTPEAPAVPERSACP